MNRHIYCYNLRRDAFPDRGITG